MGMCYQRTSSCYKNSTYATDSCARSEARDLKMCLTCQNWERGKKAYAWEWRFGHCRSVFSDFSGREVTAGHTGCDEWSPA